MANLHPALHPIKFQRTFFLIKPDGVMRGIVGDIISRIERSGLQIVAMKMIKVDETQVKSHYPIEDKAWVDRLGEKSLSGFTGLDVGAKEILGTEDKTEIGQEVIKSLVDYMQSGPVVCMVIEGVQAIDMVRKLSGNTLPFLANVGTIRGDYSVDSPSIANAERRSIHNLVHASENPKEAANEIKLWFKDSELHSYDHPATAIGYSKFY
ncbi:MAG TPA: nucleoside-diphosphate kinase [Candidatus Saccharimonadales bacterium]|nr:nucleoside-diphosphate kinase [Candidatus Saccharimonadales bacterium]